MWAIISTWRMSLEGVESAADQLEKGADADQALETTISAVEDSPYYKSVGYGGLPNRNGIVELDAGYMNGTTMKFGAVSDMRGFPHPFAVARSLSEEKLNNYLTSDGAEAYAQYRGFEQRNLLIERSREMYEEKLRESKDEQVYQGHDTIGTVVLDLAGNICAGTSTSGLFMKAEGRVGDSPLIGNGFYADSEVGGAVATGVGEEIMKGCLSFQIVNRMKNGESVQEACDHSVHELSDRLTRLNGSAGDISVAAMDRKGNIGVSTNIATFSFVVATMKQKPVVYLADRGEKTMYHPAPQEWLDEYMRACRNGEFV